MAFKVLVYSFAFKRHCNVWLLETFAILVTHPRSLINTFVVRCLDSMICILATSQTLGLQTMVVILGCLDTIFVFDDPALAVR